MEAREPLVAPVTLDFFTLFGAGVDGIKDGAVALRAEGGLVDGLEEGKAGEVGVHPVVEILDVSDGVYDATGTEDVGILGEEGRGDDAGLVLPGFEMGVREEEEEGGEGVFFEKVGEELHGVGADDRDIVVGGRVGDAEGGDAIRDIVGDLDADLEAEDADVGVEGGELDEEAAEAAADVCPLGGPAVGEVGGPVEGGGGGRVEEGVVGERVRVCALAVESFLRQERHGT